jgi:hypothetical protein
MSREFLDCGPRDRLQGVSWRERCDPASNLLPAVAVKPAAVPPPTARSIATTANALVVRVTEDAVWHTRSRRHGSRSIFCGDAPVSMPGEGVSRTGWVCLR